MNIFRSLIEDFLAWRRGEVRIASRKLTGRVYSPKNPVQPGGHEMKSKGAIVLDRRVYRAATGEWDTLPQLRTEL